jgi:alpha-galactosidase/6-phospho-beta-glucosidase family protein
MEAIEDAARNAWVVNAENPMLPAPTIIRPHDHNGLRSLGLTMVGKQCKLLIE